MNSHAIGSVADAAETTPTNEATVIAALKGLITCFLSALSKLPAALTGSGNLKVSIEEPATLAVKLSPQTSGGLSAYRNIDLDENGVNAKAAAGQLYGYYLYNAASSARYVKVYNKATAPTNADTPTLTIPLPATSAANCSFEHAIAFSAGIGLRATTGVADNDTGAPSANDVVANILYK